MKFKTLLTAITLMASVASQASFNESEISYEKNGLNKEKKYLVIKFDVHPGLVCSTSINFKAEGQNDVTMEIDHKQKKTVFIPVENPEKTIVVTACGEFPFVSTEDSECETFDEKINNSVNSVIISAEGVYSRPEDASSSRIVHAKNGGGYKIEILE